VKTRVLFGRVQYRVRWEGLSQETWLDRSALFWRGEAALHQLEEFERAVANGIITAEGGWEEAERAAAAAAMFMQQYMQTMQQQQQPQLTADTAAAAAAAAIAAATRAVRLQGASSAAGPAGTAAGLSLKRKRGRPARARSPASAAKHARTLARATELRRARAAGLAPPPRRRISWKSTGKDEDDDDDSLGRRSDNEGDDGWERAQLDSTGTRAAGAAAAQDEADEQHSRRFSSPSSTSSSSASSASYAPSPAEAALSAALAARGEYEVSRLLGDVWEGGVHWYRVSWRGFSDHDNSWQRAEDLAGCRELLERYWKKKERAKRKKDKIWKQKQVSYKIAQKKKQSGASTGGSAKKTSHKKGAAAASAMQHSSSTAAAPSSFAAAVFGSAPSAAAAAPSVAAAASSAAVPVPASSASEFLLQTFDSLQEAQQAEQADLVAVRASPPPPLPPLQRSFDQQRQQHSDYESDVPEGADAQQPDSPGGARSDASDTSELLCHPAHKHRQDTPEAILQHGQRCTASTQQGRKDMSLRARSYSLAVIHACSLACLCASSCVFVVCVLPPAVQTGIFLRSTAARGWCS